MTDATQPSPGAAALGETGGKTKLISYLLWFFFGGFGGHRFYLGRIKTGIAQLLLTVTGSFLLVPLIPLLIWLLVDAFLIPRMVDDANN